MTDQAKTPAESEVVQGGPGLEAPETEVPLVSKKKVKLSGKEFELDSDIAAALEEREAEFQKKLSEQSEEVGRARTILETYNRPVVTTNEPVDEDEEIAKLMFENPVAAVKKIRQSTMKEAEARYEKDQGQREYWQMFVSQYPELKNALWVAQQVLSNNFNAWRSKTVNETLKLLAQATKEQILALSGEVSAEPGDPPVRRTKVEDGSQTRRPVPEPEPEKAQATPLTTLISRRREARRKAMLHQK